jgi:hypothetical protein
LLGPVWADVLGTGQHTKTALAVLERYANPTIDFDELAADIASEIRTVRAIDIEIDQLEDRIAGLYAEADPGGIIVSSPGIGPTLAASILGAMADPNRFADLRAVRSLTGLVPGVDQSGDAERHTSPTKAGDPRLREALYIAAEHARRVDPTLAAKYHRLVVERAANITFQRSATSLPNSAHAWLRAGVTASATSSETPTGASSAKQRTAPSSPSAGQSPNSSDARTVAAARARTTNSEHGRTSAIRSRQEPLQLPARPHANTIHLDRSKKQREAHRRFSELIAERVQYALQLHARSAADPDTYRWQCPVVAGKVGCPLRAGTVEVASAAGLPVIESPPAPADAPRCAPARGAWSP